MEYPRRPLAWLVAALLAGCAAPATAPQETAASPAAKPPAVCEDPMVHDLVSTMLTLDMACEEIAPKTRPERERIVAGVLGEYRECFQRFQALNNEIREESKAAAEVIRRAYAPPESTTCTEFGARIERLRRMTGR